jgi:hypothetical protein
MAQVASPASGDALARSNEPRRQLVTPDQLKSHLELLRSFHTLRLSVEGSDTVKVDPRIPHWAQEFEKDVRWSWFVGLAVERLVLADSLLPNALNE